MNVNLSQHSTRSASRYNGYNFLIITRNGQNQEFIKIMELLIDSEFKLPRSAYRTLNTRYIIIAYSEYINKAKFGDLMNTLQGYEITSIEKLTPYQVESRIYRRQEITNILANPQILEMEDWKPWAPVPSHPGKGLSIAESAHQQPSPQGTLCVSHNNNHNTLSVSGSKNHNLLTVSETNVPENPHQTPEVTDPQKTLHSPNTKNSFANTDTKNPQGTVDQLNLQSEEMKSQIRAQSVMDSNLNQEVEKRFSEMESRFQRMEEAQKEGQKANAKLFEDAMRQMQEMTSANISRVLTSFLKK